MLDLWSLGGIIKTKLWSDILQKVTKTKKQKKKKYKKFIM